MTDYRSVWIIPDEMDDEQRAEYERALEKLNQVLTNPTPEDRMRIYYRALAGDYPGPTKSAIAACLAARLVELEDRTAALENPPCCNGGPQWGHAPNCPKLP